MPCCFRERKITHFRIYATMKAHPKEVETICLNRLPFNTHIEMVSEFIDTGNPPQFKARIEHASDRMVLELSKFIYGKRALGETEVLIDIMPHNWWHHLKKDLGLKYTTRRSRIKVNVEQYLLFPKYKDNDDTICVTITN